MPQASQSRTKNTLNRVNRSRSASQGGWRSSVHLGVLAAWVCLMAFGALVVWSASLTIADASISRHLLGIGLGVACAIVIWRSGFVSAGSLTLVGVLPVALVAAGMTEWLPLALCIAAIVVWKHKENIAEAQEVNAALEESKESAE